MPSFPLRSTLELSPANRGHKVSTAVVDQLLLYLQILVSSKGGEASDSLFTGARTSPCLTGGSSLMNHQLAPRCFNHQLVGFCFEGVLDLARRCCKPKLRFGPEQPSGWRPRDGVYMLDSVTVGPSVRCSNDSVDPVLGWRTEHPSGQVDSLRARLGQRQHAAGRWTAKLAWLGTGWLEFAGKS